MGKIKELAIDELNAGFGEEDKQYRSTIMGEFRFDNVIKAEGFRKRFLATRPEYSFGCFASG